MSGRTLYGQTLECGSAMHDSAMHGSTTHGSTTLRPTTHGSATHRSTTLRPTTRRTLRRSWGAALACALASSLVSLPGWAFPHVVEPGETLARIAERFYGRVQLERVLVAANHLDRTGARGLAPGALIEIPAVTFHRVSTGETWSTLAQSLLGHERRSFFLAEANGNKPWIQPELGQVISVPYNLGWVATGEESLATLAYRFMGSTKQAWALTQYNDLEKRSIERGEILLLPLMDLGLTADGKRAARLAAERLDQQTRGDVVREQTESRAGVTALAGDVRAGRYVVAVGHGAELLVGGQLSAPLRAHVQRLLLESYVALDAQGPARTACTELRKLEPDYEFDPVRTSPKILAICAEKAPVDTSTTTAASGAGRAPQAGARAPTPPRAAHSAPRPPETASPAPPSKQP